MKRLVLPASILLATALMVACTTTAMPLVVPDEDALTPGIFLDEGTRAVLPAGASLRPVYAHGLEVTKLSEAFRARLYNDVAGYCSIAYGHLIKKQRCNGSETAEFIAGVSEPRATEILTVDMSGAQIAVMTSVVGLRLNDAQYAALCDFVFNVGGTNFRSSQLLRAINQGQVDQVPVQMRRWVMAGGQVVAGLKNRREHEIALFFEDQPTPRAVPPAGADVAPIDIRSGR